MKLSSRSKENLWGVKPELIELLVETPLVPGCSKLEVVEGLRTIETQTRYVKEEKSQTMNSRHLTGDAFDFALYRDEDGDGDSDFIKVVHPYYKQQADLFKQTAKRLGRDITWGGDWKSLDGMHIQNAWKSNKSNPSQKTIENSKTIAASISGIGITVLPEVVAKATELTGSVSSFIKDEWLVWVQLVLTVGLFAFVINERRKKIDQEGV